MPPYIKIKFQSLIGINDSLNQPFYSIDPDKLVCKGHITHQGNKRVRRVLNQVAWAAIKKDRDLKAFFDRLYPRTGKKKAIVAVARKLIGRIRAAFKTGKPYLMNPIEAQAASS